MIFGCVCLVIHEPQTVIFEEWSLLGFGEQSSRIKTSKIWKANCCSDSLKN